MKKEIIFYICLLIIIILSFSFLIIDTYIDVENSNYITNDNSEEIISISDINIDNVSEDIIGYLSIPILGDDYYIDMPIKDGTEQSILATAIGHFTQTPYVNGNVCLAAHNSGTNKNGEYVGYFDSIKDLQEGDCIIYNNLSATYQYTVVSNTIINETDLSVLDNTEENLLTLITCVKGTSNRAYRQCVVAKLALIS